MNNIDYYASTAQMYNIDCNNRPISSGSGVLVRIDSQTFLLSVAHLLDKEARVGVHIDHVDFGSYLYVPKDVGRVCSQSFSGVKDLDFFYFKCETSRQICRSSIEPINGMQHIPCHVFDCSKDIASVDKSEFYSFAGSIKSRKIPVENHPFELIASELIVHKDLRYYSDDGRYVEFLLPYSSHPGHEMFQGCSGAPIFNSKGEVVALVSSGDSKRNILTGVLLKPLCEFIQIAEQSEQNG